MKRVVGLMAILALVAAGCGDDDDRAGASENSGPKATETAAAQGPLTYTVVVDWPSPEGKNLQLSGYFPGSLKVHAGDTVVFDNQSTQAPHTVTFGIDADRSNSPAPITKAPAFNPVVFGPCVTAQDPTPDLEACPEPPATRPPPYNGTGYWNSGALVPSVAPEGPKQVAVKIDESTPPDGYSYACILHSFMGGVVTVVAADAGRDLPDDVAEVASKQGAVAMAEAEALAEPQTTDLEVVNGWGDQFIAVNRFLPEVLEIKVGEEVTWKTTSPYEPHTVTFESPFKLDDPEAVPPGGVPSGGDYRGGFSNSGFMGPHPFPIEVFSLRFTRPGEYPYVCVLHPGMAGAVKVT